MAKYMMLRARRGKKKFIFCLLRILYLPFSIKYLYDNAQRIAIQYSDPVQQYATNFYSPYHRLDTFESSLYTDIEVCSFEDTKIAIPTRYKEVLSTLYGDYMTLPPVEKRNTRHELTDVDLSYKYE